MNRGRLAFEPRVCAAFFPCHCGPNFQIQSSKQTLKTRLFGLSYSPETFCHVAPWLLTGNVKGLMDNGHGRAGALELGCAEETGAVEIHSQSVQR